MQIETAVNGAIVMTAAQEYPARADRAIVRSLNRSIGSGRTAWVREIARDTGLKSKDVRDSIRMTKATFARPEARLSVSKKRLPLIRFSARGSKRSGVSYRLPTGAGRLPHAFIATVGLGAHVGVFERQVKSRSRVGMPSGSPGLPITEKFGPSLGRVAEKYKGVVMSKADEVFVKNMEHELKFLMDPNYSEARVAVGLDVDE